MMATIVSHYNNCSNNRRFNSCRRTPPASGTPCGSPSARKRGRGATPSPGPRKESLRPRRDPVIQGLPIKYALAMAISQARGVASGKRQV